MTINLELRFFKLNQTEITDFLTFSRVSCFLRKIIFLYWRRNVSAILWALQELCSYLQGQSEHIRVFLDQASLRWLTRITKPLGTLMLWSFWLRQITSNIVYKKGILNTQADGLFQLTFEGYTTVALREEVAIFPEVCTADGEQAAFFLILTRRTTICLRMRPCKTQYYYLLSLQKCPRAT